MIALEKVRFSYSGDSFELRIEGLKIDDGETVAFVGPSGCGKTTLMNLISGVFVPDSGKVSVAETEIGSMRQQERQNFRIRNIGLVPQNFELLDYLTIRENILVPFRISSASQISGQVQERCDELAEAAGISKHLSKFPSQLSQGERQRAALCRGLVVSPKLVLADEPTGNLDPQNQEKIVDLLMKEATKLGSTVVMITHEPELLPRFSRTVDILKLREGGAG